MTVLVTGGNGFLGRYVVEELRSRGHVVVAPRSDQYDLREEEDVYDLIADVEPESIVHLAARVGGIGANAEHPGEFFYENAMMGLQLMDRAHLEGVRKFVSLGTGCEYPEFSLMPQLEEELWNGYPAPVTAPYAMAKKMLLVMGQAYRAQYGFNAIHVIPTNLYGPRDNFDPESGHVVPSIILKVAEAVMRGHQTVDLWGSGLPTRDFLYVADAARGVADALELYDDSVAVNLGTGVEVSIAELAGTIARLMGFTGEFRWDSSKPDGTPRRWLDVERAKRFGFEATVSLEEGLARTIEWFQDQ